MKRRHFLATTPALFTLPVIPPHLRPAAQRVALIGCGWYGKSDLFRLLQVAEVELVGLCDVDRRMLDEADELIRQRHPAARPRLFTNHQDMLRETRPELVLIATPDHWHALQAIDAVEAGAHLYLQKPIGVDVRECEAVLDAARKYKRVVQVGMQRRSTPHLIEAKKEIVDTGLLGEIGHVGICCYYHMRDTAQREIEEVPAFFDYDRWTGPAPLLPYRGLPHRRWRAFQEYGNGIVGDMCVHMLDMTRWMLGLGWPTEISSLGGIYVQTEADATTTDTQTVTFQYPKLSVVWQHRSWGEAADEDFPWAMTLYGSKGTLEADPYKYDFTPRKGETRRVKAVYEREKFPEDLEEKDIELHAAPATRAHMIDWLTAIESGSTPVSDIKAGYCSTVSCILGNLALEAGRPLRYDPATRSLASGEEGLLARAYRAPYVHP
jgi:predicted dehydrogenase